MAGIADMLIGGYQAGNQLRQQREAEQKQKGLASLYQQAYQAPVADRQQYVAQAAGIDPQSGMQLQRGLVTDENTRAHRLVGMAQAIVQTPEEMRPQMYAKMLPELRQLGIPAGDAYSPEVVSTAQQILSSVYGGEAEQFTLAPGAARYDSTGRVIASQPFAPQRESWELVNVPDGSGGTVQMEHNAATGAFRQPSYTAPSGGAQQVMGDALTQAMIGVESGGNPNAVSPAGARGLMQVMPDTARDPGFGVQPMQNDSPEENVRFGQDYMQAMLRKYGGNQMLALAAYNGGPGRVDEALQKAGGDPQRAMQFLPQETQQYPGKVQARMGYTPPKQDNAPQGYRYNGDRLEPIPGGPADPNTQKPLTPAQVAAQQKMERTRKKDQQLLAANDAQMDQTIKLIDQIVGSKDLEGVTGMGAILSKIPGTDYADVAAKLDTLKARSAFGALQQMRANSPTGGALGQVSERELYLLQNAETQLQNSQSPQALAQALLDYKAALMEAKRRMREGVDEFYSEQAPQAESGGWSIEVIQ